MKMPEIQIVEPYSDLKYPQVEDYSEWYYFDEEYLKDKDLYTIGFMGLLAHLRSLKNLNCVVGSENMFLKVDVLRLLFEGDGIYTPYSDPNWIKSELDKYCRVPVYKKLYLNAVRLLECYEKASYMPNLASVEYLKLKMNAFNHEFRIRHWILPQEPDFIKFHKTSYGENTFLSPEDHITQGLGTTRQLLDANAVYALRDSMYFFSIPTEEYFNKRLLSLLT